VERIDDDAMHVDAANQLTKHGAAEPLGDLKSTNATSPSVAASAPHAPSVRRAAQARFPHLSEVHRPARRLLLPAGPMTTPAVPDTTQTPSPRDSSPPDQRTTASPLHVVGIGASAGGLDALERFFDNLPTPTTMAFVIVQHLSPDFKSLMDELLARHTSLPIHLVEDGMLVEGGHVYLIPPKKEMIISEGRLLLSERQQELTLPIDVFFRSLAQDCGANAVAIVLSGGGSDGSRGIRAVYEADGLVLVQDVESAQFDGMPRTARDAGVAHWVLAPEDMPAVLVQHLSSSPKERTGNTAAVVSPGIGAVYRMLQTEFGIDFTNYKPSTVTRRIERRLALARTHDIQEYVQRLQRDREELDVLYRDLLIGVTRFFRDEKAFELLESQVLPEILDRAPHDAPLRFWVAGCATGEEAYSLAIVLQELMPKLGKRSVKIFATDVHKGSLERAAHGIYDDEAVAGVSRDRLAKYFLRTGGMFQVVPELRQMIVFAAHDVIKDAPFTRVDMISCRNLLIYFQPSAQQKVLSLFHFALNRGGALFLGPSETVGPLLHDFESIDKHWQIYRKHTDVRMAVETRMQPRPSVGVAPLPSSGARNSLAHLLGTYDAVLDDVMPPSLLVSDRGELVHAFGGASRFLRVRDGRQGLDVLDVVDSELRMVLVGGLKRALHEPSEIVFKGVRIGTDSDAGIFKVTIRRYQSRTGGAPHLLVSFDRVAGAPPQPATKTQTEIDLDQVSREQLGALEAELSHTKENLQAAIEELETSNEELQASNEELQASNEELQSTNEELQSVNEELYTVNAEYQRKISELTLLTNDMDNLLSSTEVGTIFLDRELRIRKFTPQIAETFELVVHDVGRPIATFAGKLAQPGLIDDLQRVLVTGNSVERELPGVKGRAFFSRILPYRVKGTIDGVVLTLIDVSGLKKAEDALFHERYLLNSLLVNVPDAIYFKDARGQFIRANQAMATRLGLEEPKSLEGKSAFELPDQAAALALHKQDEAVLRTGRAQHYELEKRIALDGSDGWDLVTRLPLTDGDDHVVGIIVIFRDVTEQKASEERIKEDVRLRDEFLAMLSHELRNPLGAIVSATALLRRGDANPPGRLIELLDRQSKQMSRLLDDLLEAARVTQNKIELRKTNVELGALTREAADAVRDLMDSRGVGFVVEIDTAPLTVEGDPARLQQIEVNLLTNAAKYTPRGGHVWLHVGRDSDTAVIRVRDDGAGIAPDMLDSVFDLFVQSARTLDRSAGGLGVGLTLVRSLVSMHGGTVTAASDGVGKGSELTVRIPLSAKAEQKAESTAPRSKQSRAATIVLVEDNLDSLELLFELLVAEGYRCNSATDGVAALKLIDELRPDIAILDVGLPEMDGFEIARRLRSDRKHDGTHLIAMTGYGRASDRAMAKSAGFDQHLVKPVATDELLALLGRIDAEVAAPV
jgi:two-component system CheB/CheR fusion protein